jgi:hypothetical protein
MAAALMSGRPKIVFAYFAEVTEAHMSGISPDPPRDVIDIIIHNDTINDTNVKIFLLGYFREDDFRSTIFSV